MPELHQLRYFVEVADQHSFRKAGEALHVSQSAISQQIGALERECRCPLFIRARDGVELTSEGMILADHARRVLLAFEEAENAIARIGPAAGSTRLRLGSSVGPLLHLLPSLMEDLSARYPGLVFNVQLGATVTVCARVLRGSLDVGIANMPVPDGLAVRTIYEDRLQLLAATGHPLAKHRAVSLRSLRGLPLVSLPKGHPASDDIHAACQRLGFSPRVVLETDNGELLREFVARGLAVAVVPSLLMRYRDDPRLVVRPLERGSLVRTLVVITRQPASGDSLTGEFIDALCRLAGSLSISGDNADPRPVAEI